MRNLFPNLALCCLALIEPAPGAYDGALAGVRHHILVSTDVSDTDLDDTQFRVDLLVYVDSLDLERLVSSPCGPGRRDDILAAIDAYAKDYLKLKTNSDKYPTSEALRAIVKQRAKKLPGLDGIAKSTEGSRWIIECAKREDSRPLHVPVLDRTTRLAQTHPNWGIDDPSPLASVLPHSGAKSVSQWPGAYLRNFANRMNRCMSKPLRN